MFRAPAEKITDKLCADSIVPVSDRDLYTYGFNMGFTVLFNIISTVFVGAAFGMVFESIAFLVCYIPLRSYAGGYHAEKPWSCYVISLLLIAAVLSVMKYLYIPFYIETIVMIISIIICLLFAPVEDHHKPLDDTEVKVFKKRFFIVLVIEIILWVILHLVNKKSSAIMCSMSVETVMLIIGKIKNLKIAIDNKQVHLP